MLVTAWSLPVLWCTGFTEWLPDIQPGGGWAGQPKLPSYKCPRFSFFFTVVLV